MNCDAAIKIIMIKSENEIEKSVMEAGLMQQINSQFVLKCTCTFANQSGSQFFIVMPFLRNGNLADFIKNNPSLTTEEIAELFEGILYGIIDMHAHNILHNDLKLDNILLSNDLTPVIGDLGLSRKLINEKSYLKDVGGAILYSSPESMFGKAVKESDYFSAGMILLAMCCSDDGDIMMKCKYG